MWPQIAAAVAQQAIGQKQLGGTAPAFTPGVSQGVAGLLGPNVQSQPSVLDLVQKMGAQQPAAPIQATPDMQGDPVAESLKQQSLEDIDDQTSEMGSPFSRFLGGLDKGLQSPSQMLGLGLLSRLTNQNPYAGLGGLLAMGLYNRNK